MGLDDVCFESQPIWKAVAAKIFWEKKGGGFKMGGNCNYLGAVQFLFDF